MQTGISRMYVDDFLGKIADEFGTQDAHISGQNEVIKFICLQ
jgi:hypothetical protein